MKKHLRFVQTTSFVAAIIAMICANSVHGQLSNENYGRTSAIDHITQSMLQNNNPYNRDARAMMDSRVILLKLDSIVRMTLNLDNGEFENSDKGAYEYDLNHNPTLLTNYVSSGNNAWLPTQKFENSYNSNNLMTEQTVHVYSQSNWNPFMNYVYEYDNNGLTTSMIQSSWVSANSSWEPEAKVTYAYNANNNTLVETYFTYSTSTNNWVNFYKYDFVYLADQRLSEQIRSNWQTNSSSWTLYGHFQYIYDDPNNTITLESGPYDANTDSYNHTYRAVRTYNDDDDITSEAVFYNFGTWYPDGLYNLTYDGNGNNIEFLESIWSDSFSDYEPTDKTTYVYDLSTPIEQLVLPANFEYMNYKLDSDEGFEWSGEVWEQTFNEQFYYSEQPVNVNELNSSSNVQVFPVPADDLLFINHPFSEMVSFSVYDNQGKLVLTENLNTQSGQINISALTAGFYTYKVLSADEMVVGNVVIK